MHDNHDKTRLFVICVRKAFTFQKEKCIIKNDNLIILDINAIKIVHNIIVYNII